MDIDQQKLAAAERALDFIESGMRLGLGTGSTAAKLVDLLGVRVAQGLDVIGVPTSKATHDQAKALNIPLTTLSDQPELDLTIDGADELDGHLRLIKGGGGALLREKIVAAASKRMLVITDASKRVESLGKFPLPIEVISFGLASTRAHIKAEARALGCEGEITLRMTGDDQPFVTDNGNAILDCSFGLIEQPEALAAALVGIPGVVEHGLFIGLADTAIVAGPDGVDVISA
jgi:ribose 5-phosphate isomerase A